MRAPRGAATLTAREREVLRLVAEGLPGKQIARALGISERTVKFHVTSLLTSWGPRPAPRRSAIALEQGLL